MGKNIGGTLGAPFEAKRGLLNVHFYTQELHGEPWPNDDLDLQLVWLNAVEKYGRAVDANILGEYWLSFITPHWGEYGAGKNNMRQGIVPPLSGYVNNAFRDSNGAYIRSEIWACLAPGRPEIAVQYAYEDAIVDHSGEGVYGEIFFAALQSAAFAESDMDKLIEIGLSYIPKDCDVAGAVHCALKAYREGLTWEEARIRLMHEFPSSFGILSMNKEDIPDNVPVGPMGYDAPANVGITIIGWVYGEGDFGESICIATNCGEDTDCTAATIGSIMGIIGGIESIPERWSDPIGDAIKTLCINLGDPGTRIPATVTELTDRIVKLTPSFLGSSICDVFVEKGYSIAMQEGEALKCRQVRVNAFRETSFLERLAQGPFVVPFDFTIFQAEIDYGREPYIQASTPYKIRLRVENRIYFQQWIHVNWYVPPGWRVEEGKKTAFSLEQYHCNIGSKELEFTIVPSEELLDSRYDLVIELTSQGRPTKGLIPLTLIHTPFPAPKGVMSI
ncbi:ADP-ribosylglycohydrolase family protein [Cohnella fermenti]|nr:ADP-ribosylglycohydrolase family protein [Cohnella fermenti]